MGKYIYIVEVDTQQAHKSINELRQLFQRGLGDIALAPTASAALGQTEREQQSVAKAADQAQKAMVDAAAAAARLDTAIARAFSDVGIDPAKADIIQMDDALEKLEKQISRTRGEIESLWVRVPEQTKLAKNALDEYYKKIADTFSPEEAAYAKSLGLVYSLGDMRREFPQDQIPPIDWNVQARAADITEKQRLSAAEKEKANQLELQEMEEQIAIARLRGEIAERNVRDLHQAIQVLQSEGAGEDDLAQMREEANRLFAVMGEAGEEEARLIQEYTRVVERIETELAEARAKAERTRVQEAGGVAVTSTTKGDAPVGAETVTTISVRKTSVDNTAQMAKYWAEIQAYAKGTAEYTERSAALSKQENENRLATLRETSAVRSKEETERIKAETDQQEKVLAAQKAIVEERNLGREVIKQARLQEDASKRVTQRRGEEQKRLTRTHSEEEKRRTRISDEEAKRQTAAVQEALKQQTAERRKQLRLEEAEAKAAMRKQNRAPRGLAANFINPQNIIYGLGAAAGVYSIDTAIRQFYDQGKLGAQQERTAQTFEFLADRVESSSDRIINAMKEASAGTINDADAMALAAQVLAQRFAGNRENIEEDLAIFTRAARRFTQVYVDESGNFLSTQEVFGRLVKFIREGNKELVDQFGISNQLIADILEIPNEGLRGSEGAGLRFEGVVRILTEELDRLGESSSSNADRLEASEARITDSMNRIRQAAAPATAGAAEFVADMFETLANNFDLGTVQMDQLGVTNELEDLRAEYNDLRNDMINYFDVWRQQGELTGRTAEKYELAKDRMAELQTEITRLTRQSITLNTQIAEMDPAIRKQAEAMGELSDISNPVIRNLEDVGAKAIVMAYDLAEATASMDSNASAVANAVQQYLELNSAVADLIPNLEDVAMAAGNFAQTRANLELYGGFYTASDAYYPNPGYEARPTAPADNFDENLARLQQQEETEKQKRIDQAKTEKKAREAWQKAAEDAAKAWADELESALQAVPGLFGTSDVTEQDLKLSEFGQYQEKADEYLRQLRDEVLNGVDYENVDIQDAAKRANIDPSLPAEIILTLFEQAWADSSLFAEGANLDLINQDAVQAELDRQARIKSGQDAIRELFGLPTEETGTEIGTAAGDAFIATATAGSNPDALAAAALGDSSADPLVKGVEDAGMSAAAEAMIAGLESAFDTDAIRERFYNLGYAMPGWINEGWDDGVADQTWGGSLIDAVAAQVLEELAAATEAENGGGTTP